MQTSLPETLRADLHGQMAERAIRACVHCGFCNAVCPTYQVLAEETDGPRGRIYLIKGLLEGRTDVASARRHLDRCLTCRACERACPSGVPYASLLETGRAVMEHAQPRSFGDRILRRLIRSVVPYRRRVRAFTALGRLMTPVLPRRVRRMLRESPEMTHLSAVPPKDTGHRAMLFSGCVQEVVRPGINHAASRLLTTLGWRLQPDPGGCCGALSHHLSANEESLRFMRANVDAWWPLIESGLETIVVTASGCAAMLVDYGRLLAFDPTYGPKAQAIASRVRDLSACMNAQDIADLDLVPDTRTVALHRPCTLDHSLNQGAHLEALLRVAGFNLRPGSPDAGCCGSAGSYSLLEPSLAQALRRRKLAALGTSEVDLIVTANIGCQLHLAAGTRVPVQHWAQALALRLPS
ncbi:MAG: glycolate oxidase subunit GlcF [Acidiferrobacteraceae bacterium]